MHEEIKTYKEKIFYHPLFLVLIYLFAHFLIRISFSDTLQVDDREQIFTAQELKLGYDMPQPPLYSWLSYFFFQIFGVNIYALSILKYLLIFFTFSYLWRTTKILEFNKHKKKILLFSYLLMPSFAWHMHQGFTHTILLGLGIAMSFYYLMKILEYETSPKNYFLLGVSLGIGIMGKYSFIIFSILTLLSIISITPIKKLFLKKELAFLIFGLVVVAMPHFFWLIGNSNEIITLANDRLNISSKSISSNFFAQTKIVLSSFLGFISPLFLFIFYYKRNGDIKSKKLSEFFLDRFFIFVLILGITVPFFISFPEVKVRWLHPVLMLFPFWLIFKLDDSCSYKKVFNLVIVVFTLAIIFVRLAQVTVGPKFGYYSRINIPITNALEKIPENLLDEVDVIKTNDYFLGPHLFNTFPGKEIVIFKKRFNSLVTQNKKKCLILMDDDQDQSLDPLGFEKILIAQGDFNYSLYYKIKSLNECY